MPDGVVIAAPSSGSGKTTVTLGLLRCLRRSGARVSSFKAGPDYIDPAFHAAAAGRACLNLDGWAMRPETLAALFSEAAEDAGVVIGEGVMGLFDGPPGGSTADLAATLGLPVLLVVDAAAQAQSAAAVVHGFASWRADVRVAGVVFNRVGGDRHAAMLRAAMEPLDAPVVGCLPRAAGIALPSRHLGLVQASETPALETFIEAAADLVAARLDLEAFRALLRAVDVLPGGTPAPPLPPLGQRVAVASDDAFRFSYPHVLDGWRRAGAEIVPFSPLADEPPDAAADAVYLPGGYPELHAGRPVGGLVADHKSALQEWLQARGWPLPEYAVAATHGPDHRKVFEVDVRVGAETVARAEGRSKKEAEQTAAAEALELLGRRVRGAQGVSRSR